MQEQIFTRARLVMPDQTMTGTLAVRDGMIAAEVDGGRIALEPDARALAEQAAERLRLSARGFTRTIRVARSIADLAGIEAVRRIDVAEALAYRHRVPGRQI